MGQAAVRVSRPVAVAAAPVIVVQGRQVRRATPVLPEAAGPREGTEGAGEHGAELALLVLGESTAAGVGAGTQAGGLGRQAATALASRTGRPGRLGRRPATPRPPGTGGPVGGGASPRTGPTLAGFLAGSCRSLAARVT